MNGYAERLTNGETMPEGHVTGIPTIAVTEQRKPFVSTHGTKLQHPGTARANIAPSVQAPQGTTANDWAKKHSHQSVLEQHCDFFDRDHDGILWPQDTFVGFHRLGFGVILSAVALFIIHINFSWPTSPSWIPDPFFRIYLKQVDRTKHGGDTGTYDNEGRFVPQKFEEIFTKYADGRDYLTGWDIVNMIQGQRNISDPIGWGGAIFEWTATYLMLWPKDGRILKEDVRGIYDGSLFYNLADRLEKEKKEKNM